MSIDGTIRLPDAPAPAEGVTGGLYDVLAGDARPEPGRGPEVLAFLAEAATILDETPAVLTQLGEAELTDLMGVLLRLQARAGQVAALTAADATERGTVMASDAANTQQWITGCAASAGVSVEPRDAKTMTVVAQGSREQRNRVVASAVRDGACTLLTARRVVEQTGRVAKILPDLARDDIQAWFLQLDPAWGSRGVDELTRQLRARHEPDALEAEDAHLEEVETLTWRRLPTGMWRLVADLSPATAAVVKQAITAMSAPGPATADKGGGAGEDTGPTDSGTGEKVRDERLPGKRRVDALVDLVGAGAKVANGDGTGVGAAATLLVTMNLDDLLARVGAATTITGDVLDPGTARRLACDADLIPLVLGKDSEPLDVGREKRLVTGGMRAAVVFRDKGCTFPGCDRPPGFCDVHHPTPWWAGGDTSLTNSALLCHRHHQVVHRKGYFAIVTATGVIWNLTIGAMPGWTPTGYRAAMAIAAA